MVKKKVITNTILLALEKAIDGYVRFEDFTTHAYRYHYGIPELRKSELAIILNRLRRNGFVELIDEKELIYGLTDSGKDKALWARMKMIDEKWDGKWRIVVWDIPENKRRARDLLRFKLKMLGFKILQKSIWVSKKNCTRQLREFIGKVGIKDWVLVFESDNLEY